MTSPPDSEICRQVLECLPTGGGFADQRVRKPDVPLDPLNRRISLIVQYQEKAAGGAEANGSGVSAEKSALGQAKQESTGGGESHAASKKE